MTNVLRGLSRLYVDANIIIYLLEGNAKLRAMVEAAMQNVDAHRVELFTSEITLTECMNGALRAGVDALAEAYFELLSKNDFITLIPVQTSVCVDAARFAAAHRLKTVDAIHFASAVQAECQVILTNDTGFRGSKDMKIIPLTAFAPKVSE